MIKYDLTNINKWYNGSRNIVKCYHGTTNAFDLTGGGSPTPTGQTPCYAVTDDISQYQSTEFVDVYDTTADKWYKLNNLNQFEEYGIYGSGRTNTTYYEGKLTIDEEIIPAPSRLPQGYTEVECIQNTGTSTSNGAYINSGLKLYDVVGNSFSLSGRVKSEFYSASGYDDLETILNSEDVSSPYYGFTYRYAHSTHVIGLSCNPSNSVTLSSTANTDGSNDILINCASATVTTQVPLGLFASYNANYTTPYRFAKATIYSLTVVKNGVTVRDFVPAKRDSDSKYGLYDLITDTFYTSPNGNNFSGGTEVTPPSTSATCEFVYIGNSWVNLGEVSGSTATLPNVPFTVNYNAKNYNPSTYTIPMTDGQLNNMDAVITGSTNLIVDHHEDGYIELTGSTSSLLRSNITNTSVDQYFNRDANNPNLTIICKAYTPGSSTEGSVIVNREGGKGNYNWMYRHKSNRLTLHGTSEQGSIAVSNTVPNICSARIDSNKQLTYNNYTQGTTSTYSGTFNYGSTTTTGATLFAGYSSNSGEQWKGVFYWVYMSQNTLTDEQVQQVIDYNEGNGGSPTYPEYYDEIAEPPTSVTFATMADALAYQCPYVGLRATIAGDRYIFNSNYEWEEIPSRLPQGYTELTYAQTPNKKTLGGSETFFVPIDLEPTYNYIFSFTPLSWEDSYYSPLVGGAESDSTNKYSSYGIYKLDNGWGDMSRRFEGSFYNYNIGTRSAGALTGGWRVYTDVKATIKTHLVNYAKGNGVALTVENEGYETVNLTSTTINNSSYTVVDGIYNLQLFTGYGNNAKTPYLKFHELSVKTNNNQYIYQYVPAKRDSDDKVGLFDIINEQFYYPSTFNLTAGDPV